MHSSTPLRSLDGKVHATAATTEIHRSADGRRQYADTRTVTICGVAATGSSTLDAITCGDCDRSLEVRAAGLGCTDDCSSFGTHGEPHAAVAEWAIL